MEHRDSAYFNRRARQEQAAAARAADERARQSHRDLAERYLELARGGAVPIGAFADQGSRPIGHEFRIIE